MQEQERAIEVERLRFSVWGRGFGHEPRAVECVLLARQHWTGGGLDKPDRWSRKKARVGEICRCTAGKKWEIFGIFGRDFALFFFFLFY